MYKKAPHAAAKKASKGSVAQTNALNAAVRSLHGLYSSLSPKIQAMLASDPDEFEAMVSAPHALTLCTLLSDSSSALYSSHIRLFSCCLSESACGPSNCLD